MRFLTSLVLAFFLTLGSLSAAAASQSAPDNSRSLDGLTKASVYFDVSLRDDALLVFRMEMVNWTIKSMEEAGLEVTAVIGFRGHASRFITDGEFYVLDEEIENKKKIQEWIRRLSSTGIVIEQCAIAADILDIATDDFLPEVTVVGNGYISLAGYQAKGYSVIPMD